MSSFLPIRTKEMQIKNETEYNGDSEYFPVSRWGHSQMTSNMSRVWCFAIKDGVLRPNLDVICEQALVMLNDEIPYIHSNN